MTRAKKKEMYEKKRSITFSLCDSEIAQIESAGTGRSLSEKLISIIGKSSVLAKFDTKKIEEGEYSPEYIAPHAVLVYQRAGGDYEVHPDFEEMSFKNLSKAQHALKDKGFQTCIVEYKELGFVSLWARKEESPCVICHNKIFESINKALKL